MTVSQNALWNQHTKWREIYIWPQNFPPFVQTTIMFSVVNVTQLIALSWFWIGQNESLMQNVLPSRIWLYMEYDE